jgi:hypothetical protein
MADLQRLNRQRRASRGLSQGADSQVVMGFGIPRRCVFLQQFEQFSERILSRHGLNLRERFKAVFQGLQLYGAEFNPNRVVFEPNLPM